ncbi:MAG: hypothetical protein Ct9H300mP28_34240 [Pseudomonadota bacterium]|nr:MAG: hypothetical protein Ct9H300mP28_34240 [Pseudomonadota bacterium]
MEINQCCASNCRVWENLVTKSGQLIQKTGLWGLLINFVSLLRKSVWKRSLNMARKEFEFDISNPNRCILKLNRNSPSNRIIEELAIPVMRNGSSFS